MNVFSDTRTVKSMGICSGGVRNVRLFCVRPPDARDRTSGWIRVRAFFAPLSCMGRDSSNGI